MASQIDFGLDQYDVIKKIDLLVSLFKTDQFHHKTVAVALKPWQTFKNSPNGLKTVAFKICRGKS